MNVRKNQLLEGLLVTLIFIFAALKFRLLFYQNINWDEFYYLSLIYEYHRGILTKPLQTIFVHFFGWLRFIPGTEIDQIIVARIVMYFLSIGSACFIYLIGKKLFNRKFGLIATFFYFSYTNILDHGASFRADIICSFLFLFSIYLMLLNKKKNYLNVFSGFLMALSIAVSIKSVIYLPVLGMIFGMQFFREENRREVIIRGGTFLLAGILGFSLLYLSHKYSLYSAAIATGAKIEGGISIGRGAASKVFIFNERFPRRSYLLISVTRNPIIWLLIIVNLIFAIRNMILRIHVETALWTVSLCIPILSLLFYRNAFPYYYVFIMPPAFLTAGIYISKFTSRSLEQNNKGSILLFLIIIGTSIGFFDHYSRISSDRIVAQREIVNLVHQIFPSSVNYVDRNSMISSFSKVGFFMSTWGMEGYREAGKAVMSSVIEKHQPKFLLANTPLLELDDSHLTDDSKGPYRLFNQDVKILRDNFIHHWGILYVAGKKFNYLKRGELSQFDIMVPGPYTIESRGPVSIDSVIHHPHSILVLKKGVHEIGPLGDEAPVVLRWGENIYRPSSVPSTQPVYYNFEERD